MNVPDRRRSAALRGRDRLWLVSALVGVVLILGGGIVTLLEPQRTTSVAARTEAADAQSAQVAELARLQKLRADNQHLATYRTELAAKQAALPTDDALPDLLRELQAAGVAARVAVGSVSVSPPTAVTAATPAAPVTTAAPAAATGVAGASAAVAGNLYAIGVSLTVTGSSAAEVEFLRQLQQVQPRALLLTSVSQATTAANGAPGADVTLTLGLKAFVSTTTGLPAK